MYSGLPHDAVSICLVNKFAKVYSYQYSNKPCCTYRKEVFKDAEIHISRDINDKELEQAVRFLHDNGQVMLCGCGSHDASYCRHPTAL